MTTTTNQIAARLGHSVGTRDREYIYDVPGRIASAIDIGHECDGKIGIEGFMLDGPAPDEGVWTWDGPRNAEAFDLFHQWRNTHGTWMLSYYPRLGHGRLFDRPYAEQVAAIAAHLSLLPTGVIMAFDGMFAEDEPDLLDILQSIGPVCGEPPVRPEWSWEPRSLSVYTEHHWWERNGRKPDKLKPDDVAMYFIHAGMADTIEEQAHRVAEMLDFGAFVTMNFAEILRRATFREFLEMIADAIAA